MVNTTLFLFVETYPSFYLLISFSHVMIKDNFIKSLIIYLCNTKLIDFLTCLEISKQLVIKYKGTLEIKNEGSTYMKSL